MVVVMPADLTVIPPTTEVDDPISRMEVYGRRLATQINALTQRIVDLKKHHREKIAPEYEPLLREIGALYDERVNAEREAGENREFALLWAEAAGLADDTDIAKYAEKVLAEVKEEESEAEVTKRLDKAIGTARWAYSNIADLSNESYTAALALAPRLKKALEDLREFKRTKAPRLAVLDTEFKKIKAEIDQLVGEREVLRTQKSELEKVYAEAVDKENAEEEAKERGGGSGGNSGAATVVASGSTVAVAAGGGASSAAAAASCTTATASSGSRSGSGSSPGSGSSIATPFATHPIAAVTPVPAATPPVITKRTYGVAELDTASAENYEIRASLIHALTLLHNDVRHSAPAAAPAPIATAPAASAYGATAVAAASFQYGDATTALSRPLLHGDIRHAVAVASSSKSSWCCC